MNILEKIKNGFLLFDGAMGTMLIKGGLKPGEIPEKLCITDPDRIINIHRAYLDAGCDVVSANTFGANPFKFDNYEEIIRAAMDCANEAVNLAKAESDGRDCYVALDIGSTGEMLKPAGDLEFEDAVEAFAKVINAGKNGADVVLIETMNDLYELRAAVLAAKENCDLPVIASVVFNEKKTLMTGADPAAVVAMLEGLGVDALGMNCSLGPKQLKNIVPDILRYVSVPVIVQPNAGIPAVVDGKTVYDVTPEEFVSDVAEIARMGARILGGCCGTTPDYIKLLREKLETITPVPVTKKNHTLVSSYTHAVDIKEVPVLIGERINPTGKSRFKQALRDGDIDYIMNEAFAQTEKGVHILDVNVGLPEIDEPAVLTETVRRIQAVIDLPLQIDTSDPVALERAMRIYNGKPLVNSVNGKQESMDAVLPLVKKYGGAVVALTLDENGIPDSAEGRLAIAERIVNEAAKYGIDKKDIVVDTLAMAVSSDKNGAKTTLKSIRLIKEKLGVCTCLGVSNISFGLPDRPAVNASFFAMAIECGLDAAIINPYSLPMMTAYYSGCALTGRDEGFVRYIDFANANASVEKPKEEKESKPDLQDAIIKGQGGKAAQITQEMLKTADPLDIINEHIVPALDFVGTGFENNRFYLPQLLMSAEAAQSAFDIIKKTIPAGEEKSGDKILLATVKGDIHDIGKNIVKVLLENYGYEVVDLGRDVDKEAILNAVIENDIKMVGLSALMTTTVPAMEEATALLKQKCPDVKVTVGGAVLTQEYADMIGADFYSKEAMATVRYAEKLFKRK